MFYASISVILHFIVYYLYLCFFTDTGAQCKAEVVENVAWERTPANQTASVPCPGYIPQSTQHGNFTRKFQVILEYQCIFTANELISICSTTFGSIAEMFQKFLSC